MGTKRLLAVALILLLLAAFAAGCKKDPPPPVVIPTDDHTQTPGGTPAQTPQPIVTPDPTSTSGATAEPFAAQGVRGYIDIPNTKVQYPLVVGTDNDFYLTHDHTGKRSYKGAIFIDYRNRDPLRRRNIVLGGHNMKDDTMFGSLHSFDRKKFFDENSYMELELWGTKYEYEIVYAGIMDARNYYFISTKFENEQAFIDYFTQGIANATYTREGYTPQAGDEMATMFTCVSHSIKDYDHKRLVVVARKVRALGQAEKSTMEYDTAAAQPTGDSDNTAIIGE